ncbi:hypothetical protein, partial [Xanthovirga aplysinae]|uniref:hypothetical protein n=1 Tax=Xanthovirga aplysinae TaxID=2529853 RepID=UPI0012BBA30E
MATDNVVNISNQLNQALDIFTFTVPSDASASDLNSMYPLYSKVGTVSANDPNGLYTPDPDNPLENL